MWSDASVRRTRTPMTDLDSILSENLDSILKPNNNFENQVKKIHQETANKYCLWHRNGEPTHWNNFGLMGECRDCLAEIERGRCSVDVCNFELDTYWNVRNFWLKVDIKGPDECWPWMGATRRNNQETVAYMPSPFHSAKTQSASRVAFWLSRGYTGKYRVFHQEGCNVLCCNPLHLRIKELVSVPQPTEITTINLSYGNIFDRAKTALQAERGTPE